MQILDPLPAFATHLYCATMRVICRKNPVGWKRPQNTAGKAIGITGADRAVVEFIVFRHRSRQPYYLHMIQP